MSVLLHAYELMDRQQAIALFSPTDEERRLFPHMRKYGSWLDENLDASEPEPLRRAVLAGLFPTYRACHFRDEPMDSTHAVDAGGRPVDRRLAVARDIFGVSVRNDWDYLRQIEVLWLRLPSFWFDPGGHLIGFVKRGRKPKVTMF